MFVYVFRPDQDIDPDDPKNGFNCDVLDRLVRRLIDRAEGVVGKSSLREPQSGFLDGVIGVFWQTHDSIRVLCRQSGEPHGHTADALSLVREQIEKLFDLQLVCEDPDKWVTAYLKDGWLKAYRLFLHEQAEVGQIPRFQEFLQKHGPDCMERLRKDYGITDEEKRVVELEFAQKPVPDDLKSHRLARFPTPGKARSQFKDASRKRFMERWYVEYERYCSFSHALCQKVVLNQVQTRGIQIDPMMRRDYLNKHIEPGLILSYLAIGSAIAEVNVLLGHNLEVLEPLSELWDVLRRSSLLAISFWDLRIGSILPQLIGGAP